jgi:hypothetical protein
MKKILNIVGSVSILSTILLSSCNKDFLNKNPTDQPPAATFYTSKTSVDMALTACYSTLQDGLFTCNMAMYDCMADNGYDYSQDIYSTTALSQGPITPTSGGYVTAVYAPTYSWIARYNIFLQTLAAYNGSDLSATVKTQYQAEARLLRALKYFDLYKFYGSVPLVTTPLTLQNQYQPKASASAVLAQINTDIDFAIANLPDMAYSSTVGHLVKSSAETLKARVLLYDAYNADGTSIPATMQQVEAVTSDIISKGYYSIAPSFRGLFCQDLGQQSGNPEFVFSVNYVAPTDCPSPYSSGNTAGRGVAATYLLNSASIWALPNFANEFEFKDGTPFSTNSPLYNASNVYKNRDPRMGYTIFSDSLTFENGFTMPASEFTGTAIPYYYYKEVEGTDEQNINSPVNGSAWPAMRYAEVLLMYAEAANEVDGPTAAVYAAINQIRNRADVKMPPVAAGLSQTQMRAEIRHERRVELAFEGFRYDDLKRWKVAVQYLNIPASESVVAKNFLPINYNLPLPQSEIDINHGVLVQNPNY